LLSAIGWLVVGADVHHAVVIAATVLIITCPCALALAVPAVQVVAAGALFRRGIFLNAGNAIERLAEADLVVFDKTGTLTLPEPAITDLAAVPSATLARAARLALSSRHPLARVLAAHAGAGRPFAEVHEAPGEGLTASIDGIEARLGSPAFCGIAEGDASDPTASRIAFRRGDETAVFTIRQALRPDAAAVVAALKARGLASVILSGDRREAVAPIAAALGIDTFAAGLRPGDKIAALEAFKAEGRRVLMVGDGLNDAPALAAAHVALSPITAIDLTQAQADAVFLGERLQPVVEAVDISRKARRLMSENLVFSVVYNAFAVPLAISASLFIVFYAP
ncbi:MAG TPA: HAD-IC family P-type ATPase, partial [Bauldia sp.]|nr:HAD-IC family P-type ATPase [Bauldia sp.]